MIRRSPCELYIKFLLTHPSGFDDTSVGEKLREMGLDFPGEKYFERLRRDIDVPSPFYPLDTTHLASQRFLMKHKLGGFYNPDDAAKVAHDLVKTPRAKELIETLTLTNEPTVVVDHMVRAQGTRCTIDGLNRYCVYYWDLSLVDSTELRALLHMRSRYLVFREDGFEVTPNDRLQAEAMKQASYRDPRHLVTQMPITPMAGMMNRMRMGFMPSQVDLSRLADATRKAATVRAFDSSLSSHPMAAAQARDFAVVARVFTDLIKELGSPDADLQRELQQLALHTEESRPPTVHQLSGGHHTVDLQPMVIDSEAVDVETK